MLLISLFLSALLTLGCSHSPLLAAGFQLKLNHNRHQYDSAAATAPHPHTAFPISIPTTVGILTSPCNDLCKRAELPTATSFLAASYVKLVEAAGARVVPVRVDKPWSEIEAVLDTVDMLLLPGGSATIAHGSTYYEVIKQLVSKVRREAQQTDRQQLMVVGFCLGMEAVLSAMANDTSLVSPVAGMVDVSLPVHWQDHASTSQQGSRPSLIRQPYNAQEQWAKLMAELPIAYHSHKQAVMLSSFNKAQFVGGDEVEVTAINYVNEQPVVPTRRPSDWSIDAVRVAHSPERPTYNEEDTAFVTAARAVNLGIHLSMYHPEKVSYEWSSSYKHLHPHDGELQYLAVMANSEMMLQTIAWAGSLARSAGLTTQYDYIDAYQAVDTRAFSDYQQVYFFE